MRKALFALLGLVATGLAVLGAILPGLPTTPFVLVALWAFAESSERLTAWLYRIPILASALQEADRFRARRAIRLRIKLVALAFAWGSVAWALWSGRGLWLTGAIVIAALAASATMAIIPTDDA